MDYDIAVIGAGPAGLTSAIYGARRGLKVIIFEKQAEGGQMILTPNIENYPGFDKVSGVDLAAKMKKQAESFGAKFITAEVTDLQAKEKIKKLKTASGDYTAKTIIICTGGMRRQLNMPGENEFAGRGVSYCALCDAYFFKNKTVAVIGGGNSAIEDAQYLADLAKKVYLVHRRDEFRAEKEEVDKLKAKKNVEFVLNADTKKIEGQETVKSLTVEINGKARKIEVDGVFIAVGQEPANKLAAKAGVAITEKGFIRVNENMETNIPGVFAAGDIVGGIAQITTAVGTATTAVSSAYKALTGAFWIGSH